MTIHLELQNLGASYSGKAIFSGLQSTILRGDHVFILGASGGGKTTLLRFIAGIVEPSAGEVRLNGQPLREISIRERARRIAYVSQEMNIPEGLKVREYLELCRFSHHGMLSFRKNDINREVSLLKRVGLPHAHSARMEELSTGERQRVRVIGAIIQDAEILIFDEVLGSLDPETSRVIFEILENVRNQCRTIIHTTHDPNFAVRVASYLILLHKKSALYSGRNVSQEVRSAMNEMYQHVLHWQKLRDSDEDVLVPCIEVPR